MDRFYRFAVRLDFYGSFTVNWGVDHSFTLENYRKLFGQGLDQGGFPSLIQTVLFSLIAAPISAILGLLIAYLLTRRNFVGKQSLEFVTLLCFAVPGTVAGVSYVVAFNHSPLYLTGTAAIIVLSMVTRNMPIGMRACMAALQQLDKSLDEASFSLRVSSPKTLLFVTLPLLKPAFYRHW
ncbi:iron(III) transport system permease [Actinobacillus equuli]|nr:iron(III) transport system permease [Actinobacillus equuli]